MYKAFVREYMCEYFYDGDTPVSDLACERRRADVDAEGVSYSKEFSFGGVWERIRITSETGARSIGRPIAPCAYVPATHRIGRG